MNVERYPLHWPAGVPRTTHRIPARFEVEFGRSRDELLHSLNLMGSTKDIILSTNVPVRQDGLPYSNMSEPRDPGVAVYFDRCVERAWKPFVIACDQYSKVRWNIRAVWATVEALRSIQRHGASTMLEQAFTGFAALPQPGAVKLWWEVLGVSEHATADEVRRAMRELANIHHPDRGGDSERMVEINRAYEQAMKRFLRPWISGSSSSSTK